MKAAICERDLLGKEVFVVANKNAVHRGFSEGERYKGRLLNEVDWLVGCPVFKCEIGVLGLGYECDVDFSATADINKQG